MVSPALAEDRHHGDSPASWAAIPQIFRDSTAALPPPWEDIFGPLRRGTVDDLVIVGQIGQSLDGRIATENGLSRYINGPAGIAHLHRLRALVDAVVVGSQTALTDDPQLTVRHVSGPNPARVVLDRRGRLPAKARLLTCDGTRRIVVTSAECRAKWPSDIEILPLPADDGHIAPRAILTALAQCGLRRILIEGGADTVSRFLAAGCLDRLHVIVAPIILGSGRSSFALEGIEHPNEALRPPMHAHRLNGEMLYDCDLSGQRQPIGTAKKST